MWQNITSTVVRYAHFYKSYAIQRWEHLTPPEYGSLLILIAVVGWLAMGNGKKRG